MSIVQPNRWVLDEIEKLWEVDPERVSHLLNRALDGDPELKWAVVIRAYLRGHISFSKVAEMLNQDRWSLQEEFRRKGIPVRIGASTTEELHAEVEAALSWLQQK